MPFKVSNNPGRDPLWAATSLAAAHETVDSAASGCGRRFAWRETDDRTCVMKMPLNNNNNNTDSSSLSSYAGFQCGWNRVGIELESGR